MATLIETAKQHANGSEQNLLVAVGGANTEWFDGKGRSCPKCGGEDRFAFVEANKSLFCRKCFSDGSHPDIVGSIAWLLGIEQPAAAKKILEHLGIDSTDRPKKSKLKATFKAVYLATTYNSGLGQAWAASNMPIVDSAIDDAGAKFGSWFQNQVLAFPIFGPKVKKKPFSAENCEIIGHTMYSTLQGTLYSTVTVKRKNQSEEKRSITVVKYESTTPQVGLIGPWEKIAAAEYILKVEGTTDMLAANSLLPDGWVAVSNSSGSKATPPEWFCQLLADKQVFVIHDNDEAGDAGAMKWVSKIGKYTKVVFNPKIPFADMDLRDWLKDKNSKQFVSWLENNSGVITIDLDEEEKKDDDEHEDLKRCLSDLTLDVLYEDESGRIEVYCFATRKSSSILSLSRLASEDMTQMIGERAITFIAADPDPGQYSLKRVTQAIALQASHRRLHAESIEVFGTGIWPGSAEQEVVLCNGTHLSVWDGSELKIHSSPRYADRLFRLGNADWYSHEVIAGYCSQAVDIDWRRGVIRELEAKVEQWTWENDMSPSILCGLVGATLMQAVFEWRPMCSILGDSNTGKSTLLDFLSNEDADCVFGKLSFRTSDTTKAGISQFVGHNSSAICIDEWDAHEGREKTNILKALRGSTGGGRSKRGTAHHKGAQFYFRHLVWLAGIYSNIERDADQNRFIELELTKPTEDKWKAFEMIPPAAAGELGRKMLAITIVCAREAEREQRRLERVEVGQNVHKRVTRNLSVPVSFITKSFGMSEDQSDAMFQKVVESFAGSESVEIRPLHFQILADLFESLVDLGHGNRAPVSQILQSEADQLTNELELQAHGVTIKDGDLFVANVARVIDNKMTDKAIRSSLLRIPGSSRRKLKMNGVAKHGVSIPWEVITDEFDLKKFGKPKAY